MLVLLSVPATCNIVLVLVNIFLLPTLILKDLRVISQVLPLAVLAFVQDGQADQLIRCWR